MLNKLKMFSWVPESQDRTRALLFATSSLTYRPAAT